MELSKRKFTLAILLCLIIGTVNGYAIQHVYFSKHQPMIASANVFLTIQTEMGSYDLMNHNVITDIAERMVRNTHGFNNETVGKTNWISLSNDASPLQTWTKLPNEATTNGAGRAANDTCTPWISSGDYAYNVTKKFTFTGDITLQCVGLQWSETASSDNNLFACAAFTQTAFANNWNLTITWTVVYNAN